MYIITSPVHRHILTYIVTSMFYSASFAYFSTACTDIQDCEAILCTNATDHICDRCRSNNGTGLGESAFENLITECERKSDGSIQFATLLA